MSVLVSLENKMSNQTIDVGHFFWNGFYNLGSKELIPLLFVSCSLC